MEVIDTKVKKWGNSLGVILPMEIVNKQKIKEGGIVRITVQSKNKTRAKDIFGILKGELKRDTDDLLREVDGDFK